mmetsp:Transcript_20278/g.57809  ORF Transcript_20278/g.57809 Transcript_20278/m.57809 type:complete len:227 (-) Transcript_20278:287-967(-)
MRAYNRRQGDDFATILGRFVILSACIGGAWHWARQPSSPIKDLVDPKDVPSFRDLLHDLLAAIDDETPPPVTTMPDDTGEGAGVDGGGANDGGAAQDGRSDSGSSRTGWTVGVILLVLYLLAAFAAMGSGLFVKLYRDLDGFIPELAKVVWYLHAPVIVLFELVHMLSFGLVWCVRWLTNRFIEVAERFVLFGKLTDELRLQTPSGLTDGNGEDHSILKLGDRFKP